MAGERHGRSMLRVNRPLLYHQRNAWWRLIHTSGRSDKQVWKNGETMIRPGIIKGTWRKMYYVPLCPLQILHEVTNDWIQVSTIRRLSNCLSYCTACSRTHGRECYLVNLKHWTEQWNILFFITCSANSKHTPTVMDAMMQNVTSKSYKITSKIYIKNKFTEQ